MKIQLATYHKRLPTIIGYNTISLDVATKASIYLDIDEIINNCVQNNSTVQLAPQTVKKIWAMMRQQHKYCV